MPRAADFPAISIEAHEVPTQRNPLGVKGAGEAGTVGALPATMNAVMNALGRGRRNRARYAGDAKPRVAGNPRCCQIGLYGAAVTLCGRRRREAATPAIPISRTDTTPGAGTCAEDKTDRLLATVASPENVPRNDKGVAFDVSIQGSLLKISRLSFSVISPSAVLSSLTLSASITFPAKHHTCTNGNQLVVFCHGGGPLVVDRQREAMRCRDINRVRTLLEGFQNLLL